MVLCMNDDCTKKGSYVVDHFSGQLMEALDDCRPVRNRGNAYYARNGLTDVQLHCWDQSELAKMGFVADEVLP